MDRAGAVAAVAGPALYGPVLREAADTRLPLPQDVRGVDLAPPPGARGRLSYLLLFPAVPVVSLAAAVPLLDSGW